MSKVKKSLKKVNLKVIVSSLLLVVIMVVGAISLNSTEDTAAATYNTSVVLQTAGGRIFDFSWIAEESVSGYVQRRNGDSCQSYTLPIPIKIGYSFDGWYDSNGNKITVSSVSTCSSLTYTAHWKTGTGTGTYNTSVVLQTAGGRIYDSSWIAEESVSGYVQRRNGDSCQSYTLPIPIKSGYSFDGWYASNGNKITVSSVSTCSSLTYTAHWKTGTGTSESGSSGGTNTGASQPTVGANQTSTTTSGNTHWQKDGTGWWYRYDDGSWPKSEWKQIDGSWYYFLDSGYIIENDWLKSNGKWYYFNESGAMCYSQWRKISGKYYYFDASGAMLANTTTPDGFYVDSDGVWDGKAANSSPDGSDEIDDDIRCTKSDKSLSLDYGDVEEFTTCQQATSKGNGSWSYSKTTPSFTCPSGAKKNKEIIDNTCEELEDYDIKKGTVVNCKIVYEVSCGDTTTSTDTNGGNVNTVLTAKILDTKGGTDQPATTNVSTYTVLANSNGTLSQSRFTEQRLINNLMTKTTYYPGFVFDHFEYNGAVFEFDKTVITKDSYTIYAIWKKAGSGSIGTTSSTSSESLGSCSITSTNTVNTNKPTIELQVFAPNSTVPLKTSSYYVNQISGAGINVGTVKHDTTNTAVSVSDTEYVFNVSSTGTVNVQVASGSNTITCSYNVGTVGDVTPPVMTSTSDPKTIHIKDDISGLDYFTYKLQNEIGGNNVRIAMNGAMEGDILALKELGYTTITAYDKAGNQSAKDFNIVDNQDTSNTAASMSAVAGDENVTFTPTETNAQVVNLSYKADENLVSSKLASINTSNVIGAFNPFHTEYKGTVKSNKITIYVTLRENEDATFVDGYAPGTFNLNYGENVIVIKIQSKSGVVRKYTYFITREDDRNSNNTLDTLTVSAGTLNPEFNPNITSYAVNVGNDVNTMMIGASYSTWETSFVTGYEPRTVDVATGINTYEIRTVSESGTERIYTITVNKDDKKETNKVDTATGSGNDVIEATASNNAYLQGLYLNIGNINFDKTVTSYNLTVPYNVTALKVYAFAENGNATVKVTSPEELEVGENLVTVSVTAEDGTVKKYSVKVIRKEKELTISSNAKLATLEVADYDIKFNKDQADYSLSINRDKNLSILATAEDDKANVSIVGNENLTTFSTLKISVTAEDGTTNVYSIDIKKTPWNSRVEVWVAIGGLVVIAGLLVGSKVYNTKKKQKAKISYDD